MTAVHQAINGSDQLTRSSNLVAQETIDGRIHRNQSPLRPGELVDCTFRITAIQGPTVQGNLAVLPGHIVQFEAADASELLEHEALTGSFLVKALNRSSNGPIELEAVDIHTLPRNLTDQQIASDLPLTIELYGTVVALQSADRNELFIELDCQRIVELPELKITRDQVGDGIYTNQSLLPGDTVLVDFDVVYNRKPYRLEARHSKVRLIKGGATRDALDNDRRAFEDESLGRIRNHLNERDFALARSEVALFQSTDRTIEGHQQLLEIVRDFPKSEKPLLARLDDGARFYRACYNLDVREAIVAVQALTPAAFANLFKDAMLRGVSRKCDEDRASVVFGSQKSTIAMIVRALDIAPETLNAALDNVAAALVKTTGVPTLADPRQFFHDLMSWGRGDLALSVLKKISERKHWIDSVSVLLNEPWLLDSSQPTPTAEILTGFVDAFDRNKESLDAGILSSNIALIERTLGEYLTLNRRDNGVAESCRAFCLGVRKGLEASTASQ